MASKKFRDKTCVYCGRERMASTGDHVVAREFCPGTARENLPKVPACVACNNAKSKLEHYVLAVLPMGSLLPSAAAAIIEQVGPRLAKNEALRRQLASGQQMRWSRTPDGRWQESVALPFDTTKLSEPGVISRLDSRGITGRRNSCRMRRRERRCFRMRAFSFSNSLSRAKMSVLGSRAALAMAYLLTEVCAIAPIPLRPGGR